MSITRIAQVVNNTGSDVALLMMNDTPGYGTFRCPPNTTTNTDAGEGGVMIVGGGAVTWLLLGRGAFMMLDVGHGQVEAMWFGEPGSAFVWLDKENGHGKRIRVVINEGAAAPAASILR
jgi:hypothetical protein